MKKALLSLFFFIVLLSPLKACYLCNVMDPTVFAYTKVYSDQKHINYIEVKWEFSDLYASMSARVYDTNTNGEIEEEELKAVYDEFFKILKENNYNTTLYINRKAVDIKDRIFDTDVALTYEKLESTFKIKIDEEITPELHLMIDYIDNNQILAYFVKENGLIHNILSPIKVTSNIDEYSLPLEISFNQKQESPQQKNRDVAKTEKPEQTKSVSIYFAELLSDISYKLNKLIVDIKENNSNYSLFLLLLLSFVYGIVHAAGPGHGKSLVASYMLSHNKDIKKALWISTLIAFVHVFSAFTLTFGIYFLLNELFSKYLDNAELIITKISGVVIILIALSMIYKKYKVAKENKKMHFSVHKPTCGCSSCQISDNSTDLGVIISAGIIPCPGTVTIFIFALSLKAYLIGFLSAIVMSFGMSLVIFVTAALSIGLRKKALNFNFSKPLEYFSLLFILLLGFFLTFY